MVFTRDIVREKANIEGLFRIGGTKKQMIEKLTIHRIVNVAI